jgi:hypothetical protein
MKELANVPLYAKEPQAVEARRKPKNERSAFLSIRKFAMSESA